MNNGKRIIDFPPLSSVKEDDILFVDSKDYLTARSVTKKVLLDNIVDENESFRKLKYYVDSSRNNIDGISKINDIINEYKSVVTINAIFLNVENGYDNYFANGIKDFELAEHNMIVLLRLSQNNNNPIRLQINNQKHIILNKISSLGDTIEFSCGDLQKNIGYLLQYQSDRFILQGQVLPKSSIVGTDDTQELTNKIINGEQLVNNSVNNDKLQNGIDATKLANGSISNTEMQHLSGVIGNIQEQLDNIPKYKYLNGVDITVNDGDIQDTINNAAINTLVNTYTNAKLWDAVNVQINFMPSDTVKNATYYFNGECWIFLKYTSTGMQLGDGENAGIIEESSDLFLSAGKLSIKTNFVDSLNSDTNFNPNQSLNEIVGTTHKWLSDIKDGTFKSKTKPKETNDNTLATTAFVKNVVSSGEIGNGDMLRAVYDPNNRGVDIFNYVDSSDTVLQTEITTKADGLSYEHNYLQLTSNGEKIGTAIEIKGGGGGIISETIKVKQFSTLPTVVENNIIAVVSELPMVSYIIDTRKPMVATEGDIWAQQYERTENLLSQRDGSVGLLNIRFGMVKQLINSTWRNRDAYMGVNNAWIKISTQHNIWGCKIDKNNSDPLTRVEYTDSAIGMTPCKMNYVTGEFDYGDWYSFINEMATPVMLNNDGTVAYELDRNNQNFKADGSVSDISNEDFKGNAMVKFKKIYTSVYSDVNYDYFKFSFDKIDESYNAYAFMNENSIEQDYIYMPMFKGFNGRIIVGSSKLYILRSIAGKTPTKVSTASVEADALNIYGKGYYRQYWSIWNLKTQLLFLIGATTDFLTTFGNTSYSAIGTTGLLRDKGAFYGYENKDTVNPIKCFYSEAVWGVPEWISGCGSDYNSNQVKIKMYPPYENNGHSSTFSNYISIGTFSSGFIKTATFTSNGVLPTATGASKTTYFGTYCTSHNPVTSSTSMWCLVGGGNQMNTIGFSIEAVNTEGVYRSLYYIPT